MYKLLLVLLIITHSMFAMFSPLKKPFSRFGISSTKKQVYKSKRVSYPSLWNRYVGTNKLKHSPVQQLVRVKPLIFKSLFYVTLRHRIWCKEN